MSSWAKHVCVLTVALLAQLAAPALKLNLNHGRVLVLGGGTPTGRLLIETILRVAPQTRIQVINRAGAPNAFVRDPRVEMLVCDRQQSRSQCRDALAESGPFDFAVDFLSAGFEDVEEVLYGLGHAGGLGWARVGHFIFVSTSSVFWACEAPKHLGPLRPDDCHAPCMNEQYAEFLVRRNQRGYYVGGNKLLCEMHLLEENIESGFPVTVLRVPDAIGPYDLDGVHASVQRLLADHRRVPGGLDATRVRPRKAGDSRYIGAMDVHSETMNANNQLRRHQAETLRFSLVFTPDVVDAVFHTVHAGERVFGETFHIASETTPTFAEYVAAVNDAIIEAQGSDGLTVVPGGSEVSSGTGAARGVGADHLDYESGAGFPTTDLGPLDITGALEGLSPWKPSPFKDSILATVRWYSTNNDISYYHQREL